MQLFLFGILVALTPSMLIVAWLLWQVGGAESASSFDAENMR